jgi:hypothetical protein
MAPFYRPPDIRAFKLRGGRAPFEEDGVDLGEKGSGGVARAPGKEDHGDRAAEVIYSTANSYVEEAAFQTFENALTKLLTVDDQASFAQQSL